MARPARAHATSPTSSSAPASDPLLRFRKEFPILRRCVYLVSHSMGAMPRAAQTWLEQYAAEWAQEGAQVWETRWPPFLAESAGRVAALLGAPPGTIAFHQNVSTLLAVVLSALAPGARRKKIVATNLNFPSLLYNISMQSREGLELELVESPDGATIPTEALTAAIDEQTLAVLIDHGIFRSGFLQDVPAITRAAHEKGAQVIVDAYQTVGCVPIDVTQWGVDFLLAGSHKWLCGGPGAAFLYVHPKRLPRLEPHVTGWFSHRQPFAFELRMDFAPDAMRFTTGTPNMAGLYAARAGLDLITQVGVETIRKKSQRLTQALVEQALADGLSVRSPHDAPRRSGMVCIDFPGAERAEAALGGQNVQVDYRPQCGVRISPHFYTEERELLSILPLLVALKKRCD